MTANDWNFVLNATPRVLVLIRNDEVDDEVERGEEYTESSFLMDSICGASPLSD